MMIRRLKSEVLTELPTKRRQRIVVPTDPHCIKKINQMLKNIKKWDETIGNEAKKGEGLLQAVAEDFDSLTKEADVSL
jgi:hypothetical protein